jgi:hypothetical protein
MALSKTLEQLLERAERKGTAVKRVREGAVMDNSSWGMTASERAEYIKSTPMINQWEVNRYITDGDTAVVEVLHYDTLIAKFVKQPYESYELVEWYGQSNTDRDALNGLCSYFGVNRGFRYRPSVDTFEEITC